MADYAFRSYEERQKIQEMVEAGLSAKDIAASLGISLRSLCGAEAWPGRHKAP